MIWNIQGCPRISIVYAETLLYIDMFFVLYEAILHYFTRPGLIELKPEIFTLSQETQVCTNKC